MKTILNKEQINYVLFHFKQEYEINNNFIDDNFIFTTEEQFVNVNNKIVFLLSNEELDLNKHIFFTDIPVFFPVNKKEQLYTITSNLVFNYDILKSAFYLLSGYQEYKNNNKDIYGRFKFEDSVQYKMNFVKKPVVNYYFEIMATAINRFFNKEIVIKRKIFNNYGLLLTHDIDRLYYYTFNNFLYKIKELAGISPTLLSKKEILDYLVLFFIKKTGVKIKDPVWNFTEILKSEQKYNYKSAFFFLEKDIKNADSTYSYSDKKLLKLFKLIKTHKGEIGLHGTTRSAKSGEILKELKSKLEYNCNCSVLGGRQHRLIFETPYTLIHQKNAGLKYDSSLGFAEYEGFRNSYCLPFKLFDFEKNKTIDVWEFPLIIMDTTLFFYRKLDNLQALETINDIISETKKFYGIHTLLWHNGFEADYPNKIDDFYQQILNLHNNNGAENILPSDLLSILHSL